MPRLLMVLLGVAGLASLSGCVVYEPRPLYRREVVVEGPYYYGPPERVYVYHGGYYGHRHWR